MLEAKRQLINGIDPSLHKRTLRLEQADARAKHFLGLAEHWFPVLSARALQRRFKLGIGI